MRLVAILTALSLAAGAAQANDAMVVKVRGLDLESAAGAATALQRADTASRHFCRQGGALDVTTLTCRRDMVARFVRKTHARNLGRLQGWTPTQYAVRDTPAAP